MSEVTRILSAIEEGDPRAASLAIQNGHAEVVRLLLHHGAETAWKDGWGKTPAQVADAYDQPEIAALLRKTANKR